MVIAIIGAAERRAGIKTTGIVSAVSAGVFVFSFETLRRWYMPRLAQLTEVPKDHAQYLTLAPRAIE